MDIVKEDMKPLSGIPYIGEHSLHREDSDHSDEDESEVDSSV